MGWVKVNGPGQLGQWSDQTDRTLIIARTDEQRSRLARLRRELVGCFWDSNIDIVTHIIIVNGMIQEVIWYEGLLTEDNKFSHLFHFSCARAKGVT